MTWLLIMYLYTGAPTITVIDFHTRKSCEFVGEAIKEKFDPIGYKYFCIPQEK